MTWRSILDRIEASTDAPGIRVEAGSHGPAEDLPRGRIMRLAAAAAASFREAGVRPGDRVVTLLPSGRPLLQAIFGSWHVGAAICVMAPTEVERSPVACERVAALLDIVRPKAVVATDTDIEVFASLADRIGAKTLAAADLSLAGQCERARHGPGDKAFIQFTSGSTGLPKAIVIEHGQLAHHLDVLCRHAAFGPSDVMVSWLPLHHDMGFVGGLLTPLFAGCALVLIPTERFLRDPGVWLATISERDGTLSPAPSFAYKILSNPVRAKRQANVSLASWRFAWIGAEPVAPSVVEEFERIYASRGLRAGTLHPSYGMAEATLGIAIRGLDTERKIIRVSRKALQEEGVVQMDPVDGVLSLLSNGSPLEGTRIEIRDEGGRVMPEGKEGRIFLQGEDVVRCYFGSDEAPQTDGWLDTGDLGFVLAGEIYVTGRVKDMIIRGGANVHANDVEETVTRGMPGLAQRAVAFAVPRTDDLRDEVVVGVEVRREPPEDFATAVRRVIAKDIGLQVDRVLALPKGSIPRTTSGKVRRAESRALFLAGKLGVSPPTRGILRERSHRDAHQVGIDRGGREVDPGSRE